MKLNSLTKFIAVVAALTTCSAASAQEAATLSEDGTLAGKAFVVENTDEAVEAKITLTQDGKVVDTVETDEQGNFSFTNVEPGVYSMLGTSNPYVGQSVLDVAPPSQGSVGSVHQLGMTASTPQTVYQTFSSAPAQSFGGTSGGGALVGGRLLGQRPLLRLGVIGGIVAIAVSDDDDDASPDN